MSLETKLAEVDAAAADLATLSRREGNNDVASVSAENVATAPTEENDVATVPSENIATVPAENLDAVIHRLTSSSVEQIDHVITKLEDVRNTICSERERVSREMDRYADLNSASIAVMNVLQESLKRWKE